MIFIFNNDLHFIFLFPLFNLSWSVSAFGINVLYKFFLKDYLQFWFLAQVTLLLWLSHEAQDQNCLKAVVYLFHQCGNIINLRNFSSPSCLMLHNSLKNFAVWFDRIKNTIRWELSMTASLPVVVESPMIKYANAISSWNISLPKRVIHQWWFQWFFVT